MHSSSSLFVTFANYDVSFCTDIESDDTKKIAAAHFPENVSGGGGG